MSTVKPIITPEELLAHWQGHRNLTRRFIEAFPEKELFEFSIGGMRPFAELVKEFLSIAVPGLTEIVSGNSNPFDDERSDLKTKADLLKAWDDATEKIRDSWAQIPQEKFREMNNLFGQYNFPVIDNILYFIDNEIHHRGQVPFTCVL